MCGRWNSMRVPISLLPGVHNLHNPLPLVVGETSHCDEIFMIRLHHKSKAKGFYRYKQSP